MNKLVEINFTPDSETLRNFGFIALIGFGVLALMAWSERFIFGFGLGSFRLPLALLFAVLAIYCLICSLVFPKANKPIFVGLSIITIPIGIVLSYVIMSFLFFIVIGSVALILRIIGKDPLERKLDESAETYWHISRADRQASDYFKQY